MYGLNQKWTKLKTKYSIRIMASSKVPDIFSDIMKIPGNPSDLQSNIEQEKVNMNYIFQVENSLTKRRPIYVRKISGYHNGHGKFWLLDSKYVIIRWLKTRSQYCNSLNIHKSMNQRTVNVIFQTQKSLKIDKNSFNFRVFISCRVSIGAKNDRLSAVIRQRIST